MDCTSARRAMLEAPADELAAGPAPELSRHLLTCDACRAAAAEIVRAERGLAQWLGSARPAEEESAALARAAVTARRRRSARRAGWAASALAAAAVATVLLVPRGRPPAAAPGGAAAAVAAGFSVTAPPGSDVVVMHTADPNIVVVWYLSSRRS